MRSHRSAVSVLALVLNLSALTACTINITPPDDGSALTATPQLEGGGIFPSPVPPGNPSQSDVVLTVDQTSLVFDPVDTDVRSELQLIVYQENPDQYPVGVTLVIEDGISVFSFEDGADAMAVGLDSGCIFGIGIVFQSPSVGVFEGRIAVYVSGVEQPQAIITLSAVAELPDHDEDGFNADQECNDEDSQVFPGQTELCNGIDDDCDGEVDDGVLTTWYSDKDGDGYGLETSSVEACEAPGNSTTIAGDCNDRSDAYHPGAEEVCDGTDNNCDGVVDEGVTHTAYADDDNDGFGDPNRPVQTCSDRGLATNALDCNDTDGGYHPGATESCWGADLNCDGILPTCYSCATIQTSGLSAGSGTYTLDPDGPNTGETPLKAYCDMETDGGGWTLAFVKNSSHVGDYGAFGAALVAEESLANSPDAASLTVSPVAGWLNLNTFPYDALRLTAYSAGELTYRSHSIQATDLRLAFGQPGYLLYGDPHGYYWCAGASSYTDDGLEQVAQPADAPEDCKGHDNLGSGWDFSTSTAADQGLTLSGSESDGAFMNANYFGAKIVYPVAGAAYGIWVR